MRSTFERIAHKNILSKFVRVKYFKARLLLFFGAVAAIIPIPALAALDYKFAIIWLAFIVAWWGKRWSLQFFLLFLLLRTGHIFIPKEIYYSVI